MTSATQQTRGPLHEQVYEELRRRIDDGRWSEGEKVPSEHALMAEFRVSRAPVRQALTRLRAEGSLEGGRGTPPRVRRVVPTQPFHTFMSFTEWAHTVGREPGQRVVSATRRPADAPAAADLGIDEGEHVVEMLRLRLLDGAPAMLERSVFPLDVGLLLLGVDLDAGSIYGAMRAHGLAPARARHVIDAIGADGPDVAELGVVRGAPLLRVRRASWTASGKILEAADDRYLPTMANFVIENSSADESRLRRSTAEAPRATSPGAGGR
ncbi:GntR family transcriptional regulator [Microbacterium marinilacus]|uniref:GntR family transcriptional regulator n=1 Tax=Microbacterium marinilacus TaxID=415209 RepID=A0ABP7BIQ9_9MICO|nr:GntR family transcriptional regulator [Microbacterium marinilacus]MBY0688511.1 GntR family transcriptional regulator [Microbacterium marinilacus]